MTVPEFLAWVAAEPHGRYELVRGEVVATDAAMSFKLACAISDVLELPALGVAIPRADICHPTPLASTP